MPNDVLANCKCSSPWIPLAITLLWTGSILVLASPEPLGVALQIHHASGRVQLTRGMRINAQFATNDRLAGSPNQPSNRPTHLFTARSPPLVTSSPIPIQWGIGSTLFALVIPLAVVVHVLWHRLSLRYTRRHHAIPAMVANDSFVTCASVATRQQSSAKGKSTTPPSKGKPLILLSKQQLGKPTWAWLHEGAAKCATEFLAECSTNVEVVPEYPLVSHMHRCLRSHPIPPGAAATCSQVEFHVPTMVEAFQVAVRDELKKVHGMAWQQQPVWNQLKKLRQSLESESVEVVMTSSGPAMVARSQMIGAIDQRLAPYTERLTALMKMERDVELSQCVEMATAIIKADGGDGARIAEDKYGSNVLINLSLRSYNTLGKESTWRLVALDGRNLATGPFPVGQTVGMMVMPESPIDPDAPLPVELLEGRVDALVSGAIQIRLDRSVGGDPDILYKFTSAQRILMVPSPDTVTYKRQLEAVRRLAQALSSPEPHPAERMIQALFPPYIDWEATTPLPPDVAQNPPPAVTILPTAGLDWSQSVAVSASMQPDLPVVCIQGPPGTGKTVALVEIAFAAVSKGQRVLCSAPSNAAVDNMVERLGARGLRVVRVGNPERISSAVQSQSLEFRLSSQLEDSRKSWGQQFRELRAKQRDAQRRFPQSKEDKDAEFEATKAIKKLSKQIKQVQRDLEKDLLRGADVVCATTAGTLEDALERLPPFDLVLLDEAGQATEPASWLPLLRGHRAVLCGDPLQLPPLVKAPEAREGRLDRSLLERAMALSDTFGVAAPLTTASIQSVFLDTQYRMNMIISEWASQALYGGQLLPAPAVRNRRLCDRPGITESPLTKTAMLLLDTRRPNGSLMWDCQETFTGGSLCNLGEATMVANHVKALLAAGTRAADIFVLSPYSAQVELIDGQLLADGLQGVEVASVDSFQGREADAVVISMVRSNNTRTVGFLSDARRINVAITRARCHVAVVCDSATVGTDPFLRQLLQYIREYGSIALPAAR